MRSLIVAAVLLLSCAFAFPKWHQLEKGYSFEHFVKEARRPYVKGSTQWAEREAIFNARLESIKAHNKDLSMTWKRGINQFADWSEAEWAGYQTARVDREAHLSNPKNKVFKATRDPTALPRFVDYRLNVNPPVLTGVKNQGSCGSCWAHSATQSIESYFALKYGQLPVLSQQQITACTLGGCGGGDYALAWMYVQENGGLNEEWTYPYTNFFAPEMSHAVTHKCKNITKEFPNITNSDGSSFTFTWWPKANVSRVNIVNPNDAHSMMEALATAGPQSISVAANHQWSDYESGIVSNNYSSIATNYSWQSINHAVQMVGYGYDFDLNMNYWIVRNSWGTNYGEQGYIRLNRPENEPCGNLTGSMNCGTSSCLSFPAYPEVTTLEPENGYYF